MLSRKIDYQNWKEIEHFSGHEPSSRTRGFKLVRVQIKKWVRSLSGHDSDRRISHQKSALRR